MVFFTGILRSKGFDLILIFDTVLFYYLALFRIHLAVSRSFVALHFYGAFAALIAKIPCRPIVIVRGCILVAQSISFSKACHVTPLGLDSIYWERIRPQLCRLSQRELHKLSDRVILCT